MGCAQSQTATNHTQEGSNRDPGSKQSPPAATPCRELPKRYDVIAYTTGIQDAVVAGNNGTY